MINRKSIKLFVAKKWGFTENNISEYSFEELDDITLSIVLREYLLFFMFTALIPTGVFVVTSQLQYNYIYSLLVYISIAVFIAMSIYKISVLKKAREYVYQLKCYQEDESNYTLDTTTFD